jgi:hypothetical protein
MAEIGLHEAFEGVSGVSMQDRFLVLAEQIMVKNQQILHSPGSGWPSKVKRECRRPESNSQNAPALKLVRAS